MSKPTAKSLELKIAAHDERILTTCLAYRDCDDYRKRGRLCPECPQEWLIEAEVLLEPRPEDVEKRKAFEERRAEIEEYHAKRK